MFVTGCFKVGFAMKLGKPLESTNLRKSIFQLTQKTPSGTVSKILHSLNSPKYSPSIRYQMSETVALKRPNSNTLRNFLVMSSEMNNYKKAYNMYEIQKSTVSISALREFAMFATRDEDPIYLADMISYAGSRVMDPLYVRSNSIRTFRIVLSVKSLVLCFFLNLHLIPISCILAINASLFYLFRPTHNHILDAFETLHHRMFYFPSQAWTPKMVANYFLTLSVLSTDKEEKIDNLSLPDNLDLLIRSDNVHFDFDIKNYEKIVAAAGNNQMFTVSALGCIIGALHETNREFEALEIYERHRKIVFNSHIKIKRFILNNLIKTLGFGGYPEYAEFILLHEFRRLNADISSITISKLCQGFQYLRPAQYNTFWSELEHVESTTTQLIKSTFGSSDVEIQKVLEMRKIVLHHHKPSHLSHTTYCAFSYFLYHFTFQVNPILFSILLTDFSRARHFEAIVRMFSIYHQWTDSNVDMTSDTVYVDPFTKEERKLDFTIFEESCLPVGDLELFGRKSISGRSHNYPPTLSMLNHVERALSQLGLLTNELKSQLKVRKLSLKNANKHSSFQM